MALKTNASFSQGFERGFGLMESVRDRQLKQDALDQQAVNDAEDRKYQNETLGLKRQDSKDLKEFRDASTRNDAARIAGQNATALVNAQTAQMTATTAGIKADTELLKQKQLTDPDSLESQNLQAQIDEKELANKVGNNNLRAAQDAIVLSDLFNLSQQSEFTDAQLAQFQTGVDKLSGGRFDVSNIVTEVAMESPEVIGGFMRQLAEGGDVDMSPKVLRAITHGLKLDQSRNVGQVVDQSFKNAPSWMQKGNFVVTQQDFMSGTAKRVQNIDKTFTDGLSGSLFVKLEDRANPDNVTYYFPPITENRRSTDATSLVLNLDETTQALAADANLIRTVGPKIRQQTRSALIQKNYGDNAGNNGVKDFQEDVNARLETNRKAIQGGGNVTSLMGMTAEHLELSREQMLDAAAMAKMKRHIEDELLFGVPAEPEQAKAMRWLDETKAALSQQTVPQPNNKTANLGQLVGENWNPQLISNLNGYFDVADDQVVITDEKALIQELTQLGYYQ